MNNKYVGILLGFICMLLTIGICVQVKTVNDTSTGVGKTQKENELRNSVLKWKEKYEYLYDESNKKQEKLEEIRQNIALQSAETAEMSKKFEYLDTLLGYTEISRTRFNYKIERC